MRLRSSILAAALCLCASSCTSKDAEAEAKAKAEAEASGIELVDIPARAAPSIEVHELGQEPRQELRIAPAVGMEETMEMTMDMRMSMQSGAQVMPEVPVPTTKTVMHSKVEKVDGDAFDMRQSVTKVEVIPVAGTPPQVVDKVRESIEPLTNYRAVMTMSNRGAVLGGQVEIPRDLPAMVHNTMEQMTQNLGQMAVPMPEPAVGPGARWTAVNTIEQNGMKLRQTGDYMLVSREGNDVVIEVTIQQELVDPEVKVPGMLGAKARVGRFEGRGQGAVQLDLAHVSPKSMHLKLDLGMSMDVSVMGQNQHMDMDMGMAMTMALVE